MQPAAPALERRTNSAPPRRHYDRAPVQEASIDLDVDLPADVSADSLLRVREGHIAEYQEARAILHGAQTAQLIGHEFRRPGAIVRARLDGFSYHKLAPYTSWEEWTPEALNLWQKYITATSPRGVTRIGVRYVNRLELPVPAELNEYLLTVPRIAPGLPQLLVGYAMRLTLQHQVPNTFILMRQATVETDEPDTVRLVLDIEAARSAPVLATVDAVRAVAEELHAIEIEMFERCITNRTRELIG